MASDAAVCNAGDDCRQVFIFAWIITWSQSFTYFACFLLTWIAKRGRSSELIRSSSLAFSSLPLPTTKTETDRIRLTLFLAFISRRSNRISFKLAPWNFSGPAIIKLEKNLEFFSNNSRVSWGIQENYLKNSWFFGFLFLGLWFLGFLSFDYSFWIFFNASVPFRFRFGSKGFLTLSRGFVRFS